MERRQRHRHQLCLEDLKTGRRKRKVRDVARKIVSQRGSRKSSAERVAVSAFELSGRIDGINVLSH